MFLVWNPWLQHAPKPYHYSFIHYSISVYISMFICQGIIYTPHPETICRFHSFLLFFCKVEYVVYPQTRRHVRKPVDFRWGDRKNPAQKPGFFKSDIDLCAQGRDLVAKEGFHDTADVEGEKRYRKADNSPHNCGARGGYFFRVTPRGEKLKCRHEKHHD